MKKIKIEFTNERIIPASGLAVVGAILGKCDFVKRCNRMDVTPNRSQHQSQYHQLCWWFAITPPGSFVFPPKGGLTNRSFLLLVTA